MNRTKIDATGATDHGMSIRLAQSILHSTLPQRAVSTYTNDMTNNEDFHLKDYIVGVYGRYRYTLASRTRPRG
jgi:hypothetical protein